ncbi:ankyrin [Lophium mytilinum]|uniref:Ankyrin n=1 Tax=Lophium mytilinum TaxID=390894 RepID=A0A6A6QL84_9PEZI|nr:ankyrin [Lophium mytilinum]
MATTVQSAVGTAQFNRVLSDFKHELSQDEVDDFKFINSDDLKKAVHRLQEQQKSEKRMQNLRRLSSFLEAMDQFDKVVSVFLNATDYLGFIWGPAKFMLLVAGSYSEALNTLLDAYQEIGDHIPLLEQYESLIHNSLYLQDIVGLIYKDILNFHRKAMKHFRQRAWKKLFHATWRTFRTDFGAIISNLQSHRRLLDSQAIFLGVQETIKAMEELHETRRVLDDECKRRQDEDSKRRQLAVISWLSAADSASDHEDAFAVHEDEPNSGLWLFQHNSVKDWIDPYSLSEPLLWINGNPGAGKTILASALIEECRRQPHSAAAFFYCKHGDPARDNFIGFARSFIFQLTKLNSSLLPFVLEKESSSGTDSLRSSKIAKEILAVAVESFDDLTIVIDGLDECVKSQKAEIVSWIRSVVASAETDDSRNLRCCFLSQDDNDTGRLLKGLPTFKITAEHNNHDISRFCRRRANEIGQNFGVLPQDVQNLAECVAGKADGMFLYAKLVMDNLDSQVSKAALKQEMKKIPPTLNQVYHRIRHRIIEESSPSEQQVAKTLLSWLLCAKRPLKWHEIQGAMSLDLDGNSFDCERRLVRDIKHFCGSLVEVRRGGAICFVHLTAKYFLQDEPALPKQLEKLNLTRLCFSHLSLDSHASDITQDSIRGYILRGEYAFTEYAVVHAFDHLLDVLSEGGDILTLNYAALGMNLRKFVERRVSAPQKRASAVKIIDNKLQVFKDEDFFNGLKHAIVYQKECEDNSPKKINEEPVLTLLPQLARVRFVLEKMIISGSTLKLDSLYSQNLFKCSEPRCESFHDGFPTQQNRDKHRDQHERIYLCSFLGCTSSMIGYSTASGLKQHEQEYHQELRDGNSFPWHGTLEKLDIAVEIENGNYAAFELWLSQWKDTIPNHQITNSISHQNPLYLASLHRQNRMLKELLGKVSPKLDMGQHITAMKAAIMLAIMLGNEEGFRILVRHATTLPEREIYRLLTSALHRGEDNIARELLIYPSSPFLQADGMPRQASYLNLTIRHGRYEILQYILENFQIDPDQIDDKGRTSLIAAAEFDKTEMATYLVTNRKCKKWTTNKKGDTPLSIAGREGHEEFISSIYHEERNEPQVQEWLRTAQLRNATRDGSDQKVKELLNDSSLHVDEMDRQGRSPWLWAVENSHDRVLEVLLRRSDIEFLRKGPWARSDVSRIENRKDGPGALHVTALAGHDSTMRVLLQSGKFDGELDRHCPFFLKGPIGSAVSGTPLGIANECGHKDTVRIIEEYKVSLDKKDKASPTSTLLPITEVRSTE